MAFLEEPRGGAIELNELKNTARKTSMTAAESKVVFTEDEKATRIFIVNLYPFLKL